MHSSHLITSGNLQSFQGTETLTFLRERLVGGKASLILLLMKQIWTQRRAQAGMAGNTCRSMKPFMLRELWEFDGQWTFRIFYHQRVVKIHSKAYSQRFIRRCDPITPFASQHREQLLCSSFREWMRVPLGSSLFWCSLALNDGPWPLLQESVLTIPDRSFSGGTRSKGK